MANLPRRSHHRSARERAEFIASILRRLFAMREDNNSQTIDFVDTLHRELGLARSVKFKARVVHQDKSGTKIGVRGPIFSGFGQVFKTANKILQKVSKTNSILLVGVDPRRICWKHQASFLDTVRSHIHPDLDRVHEWLAKPAHDTDCAVVGFEPKNTVRHREDIRHLASAILDPVSIIAAGLLKMTSWSPKLLFFTAKFFWGEVGVHFTSVHLRLKAVVGLTLFMMGCDVLLRGKHQVRMLCLTSNSVFLEVFRAVILERQGGDIIEVLHGTPSPPFDEYLIKIGAASSVICANPIQVYPLMPTPFCRPAEKLAGITWNDQASNTGIMKALNSICDIQIPPTMLSSQEFLEELSKRVYCSQQTFIRDGDPVFSIFGGRDHDDDYYSGKTFQLELALASWCRDALRRNHLNPSIVYLPHPANRSLESLCFPDGEELELFEASQLNYFVSDFGFSLYSSSMFEASLCGAHCFSPMPKKNRLFELGLMSRIHCPLDLSQKSLKLAIESFAKLKPLGIQKHERKVLQRVSSLLASHHAPLD